MGADGRERSAGRAATAGADIASATGGIGDAAATHMRKADAHPLTGWRWREREVCVCLTTDPKMHAHMGVGIGVGIGVASRCVRGVDGRWEMGDGRWEMVNGGWGGGAGWGPVGVHGVVR